MLIVGELLPIHVNIGYLGVYLKPRARSVSVGRIARLFPGRGQRGAGVWMVLYWIIQAVIAN